MFPTIRAEGKRWIFLLQVGAGLLLVRFMRLTRKGLHYPLSEFGQTKKTLCVRAKTQMSICTNTSSQPDINLDKQRLQTLLTPNAGQ